MPAARSYRLPPGPRHNLVWHLFRGFHPENTLKLFTYLAAKYGDISYYRFGPHRIVFLNHPDHVHRVLVTDSAFFIKERILRIAGDLVMGEGLLTAEGDVHKSQRRAAQPAFHRQQIEQYARIMVRHAARHSGEWRAGDRLNVCSEMARLMLCIASDALFQTDVAERSHELSEAVSDLVELPEYLAVWPSLIKLPARKHAKFFAARKRMDELIYGMIERHNRSCANGQDLLCLMRAEAQTKNGKSVELRLRDQICTILLAGHETTAMGLTWTWYLLSQHPEAEARLHQEVDAVLQGSPPAAESLSKLRYTAMVLEEALRLYPPVWGIGREAVEDFEIGPYRLPKGTIVLMSPYTMQRDPRFYDQPHKFLPERHAAETLCQPRLSFFPFSTGARGCIGEMFARTEAILSIAGIAQKWKLRTVPGHHVEPHPYITLRPKHGMWMDVEPR